MKPSLSRNRKRNSKGFSVSINTQLFLIILGLIAIVLKLCVTTIQLSTDNNNKIVTSPLETQPCDCNKEDNKNQTDAKLVKESNHDVIVFKDSKDDARTMHLARRGVVLIPFDPYNTCNGKVPQVTCLRTISLPNAAESPITIASDLADVLCNGFRDNGDHAELLLCLQTSDVTGVLVMRKEHNPNDFDFVFPSDADRILPPSAGAKIIDRKIVSMYGYYVPRSPESDKIRARDDDMGNAVWQYGATHMLNPITTLIEGIKTQHVDAVVIVAAICLRMEKEGLLDNKLGLFFDIMRAQRAPTVVMGVGMQAEFEGNPDIGNMTLFHFQKEVLGEMERWQSAPAIGVRGKITATLCSNSGITHCVPMGCPSLTISHDLNLGSKLEANWNSVLRRLENNETLNVALVLPPIDVDAVGEKAEQRDLLLNALGKVYMEHNSVFILQMPYDEQNAYRLSDLVIKRNHSELNFKKFNNVEEWVGFVNDRVDIVISTRIHCAMACIASGTPTLVIPTDYHITELVHAMSVPHVTMEDVKSGKFSDVASVMKHARFSNFEAFEKNRKAKIVQWKEILESAGLEMHPALVRIIDTSNL